MPVPPHPRAARRTGAAADAPPRAWLLAILALALVLQLRTWAGVHGYPIADSVEYLERAQIFARGDALDPSSVRSFAFSALLLPLVVALRALGDPAVLAAARLLQIALGLGAVAAVAHLGARLDRRAGLAAALALAVNPVFLRWSVEPLSGTAAMLAVALACVALARRGGFARGLVVGAWLGAAFLMAFQSLAVIACVGGLLVLRDRWKGRAHTAGWIAAIALALLAQAALDQAVYGAFGSSVWQYARENFGGTVSTKMYELGQVTGIRALQDAGLALYNRVFENVNAENQAALSDLRSLRPRAWYLTHAPVHLLAWPLIALLALGALRSTLRPRWTTTILLVACAVNVYVMSGKGSKSFRLWLPLLPMLVALIGYGFAWLAADGPARALRRVLALVLLLAGAWRSTGLEPDADPGRHGGYWDAMEFVAAARGDAAAPERIGAGYHWAILFRDGGPGLEHAKLSVPLYAWPAEPEARAEAARTVAEEIASLDWFVCHVQLFEQDPALAAALAGFEVAAGFYDARAYGDLAPVLVFRRLADGAPGRRLFEVLEGVDPGEVQARLPHPRSLDLRRRFDDGSVDQLVLLGWDAAPLPGDDELLWVRLWWYAGPTHGRDYTLTVRLTDADDRERQRNATPCWGARPTSTWAEGSVVCEGAPFAIGAAAYGAAPGERGALAPPLGGADRRGDLLPLRLWVAAPRNEIDPATGAVRHAGGLAPFHPSGLRPVSKSPLEEGWIFSKDNLALVGGFLAPVPRAARVPDDGRPLPEDVAPR